MFKLRQQIAICNDLIVLSLTRRQAKRVTLPVDPTGCSLCLHRNDEDGEQTASSGCRFPSWGGHRVVDRPQTAVSPFTPKLNDFEPVKVQNDV